MALPRGLAASHSQEHGSARSRKGGAPPAVGLAGWLERRGSTAEPTCMLLQNWMEQGKRVRFAWQAGSWQRRPGMPQEASRS